MNVNRLPAREAWNVLMNDSATEIPMIRTLRVLLRDSTSAFVRFYHFLYSASFRPTSSCEHHGSTHALFPMCLPYRTASPDFNVKGRGRMRSREARRELIELWTNLCICMFSFFECGSPRDARNYPPAEDVQRGRDSESRASIIGDVSQSIESVVRLGRGHCLKRGRGLNRAASLPTGLLEAERYGREHCAENLSSTVAMPVDLSRLSWPEQAGTIDPLQFLSGEVLKYATSGEWLLPREMWTEERIHPRHLISPANEVELARKILISKGGTLIPESEVLRDSEGEPIVAGWFVVPHKPESDRLICDRRALNQIEARVVGDPLASPLLLTRLQIPARHEIRGSGDDLSDYFHTLGRVVEPGSGCVGRPLRGAEFSDLIPGIDPHGSYFLQLTTYGMGEHNSADVGQSTHTGMLRQAGLLAPSTTLSMGSPPPTGDVFEGVHQDDHRTIESAPRYLVSSPEAPLPEKHINDTVPGVYQRAGAIYNSKKGFRYLRNFESWGAELFGIICLVGWKSEKRFRLAILTLVVAGYGVVSRSLLQNLCGCFVQASLYKRELMACAHRIYAYIENLPSEGAFDLPVPLRDKLFTLALSLGLSVTWMRDPVDSQLSATDAIPARGGRTRAFVPFPMASALYRLGEMWGERGRLDWTEEEERTLPTRMVRTSSTLDELIAALDWFSAGGWAFTQSSHINLSELRALKGEVRALCKSVVNHRKRRIVLLDSRVVVGCTAKGRSSSFKLNGLLRTLMGYTVGARISLCLVWVNTLGNPADFPSRNKPLPPPRKTYRSMIPVLFVLFH